LSPNFLGIRDKFKFRNQVPTLVETDARGYLIERFLSRSTNQSPEPVLDADGNETLPGLDNHAMGTLFEELVRRFNEETGDVSIHLCNQETNPETFAITNADLLLKGEGEEAENMVYGSTLSADGFSSREFDFMLSNPPYGKSWKTDLERMGGKRANHRGDESMKAAEAVIHGFVTDIYKTGAGPLPFLQGHAILWLTVPTTPRPLLRGAAYQGGSSFAPLCSPFSLRSDKRAYLLKRGEGAP